MRCQRQQDVQFGGWQGPVQDGMSWLEGQRLEGGSSGKQA